MERLLLRKFEKYLAAFIKNYGHHEKQIRLKFLSSAARIQKILLNEDAINEILGIPMLRFSRIFVSDLSFKFPATSFTKDPMRCEIGEVEILIEEPDSLERVSTNLLKTLGIDLANAQPKPHKYGTEDRLGDGISIFIHYVHVTVRLRGNAPPLHLYLKNLSSVCTDEKWNVVELQKALPRYRKAVSEVSVYRKTTIGGISVHLGDNELPLMSDVPAEVRMTMKKRSKTAELLGIYCDVNLGGIDQYVQAVTLQALLHWGYSFLMCIYRQDKVTVIERTYDIDEEILKESASTSNLSFGDEDDEDDGPATGRLVRGSSVAYLPTGGPMLHPRVEFSVSMPTIDFHVMDVPKSQYASEDAEKAEQDEKCSSTSHGGFTALVRNLAVNVILQEHVPMSQQVTQVCVGYYKILRVFSYPVVGSLDDSDNSQYLVLAEPIHGRPLIPSGKPVFLPVQSGISDADVKVEDKVRLRINSWWPARPYPDVTFEIEGWVCPVAARLRLDALLHLFQLGMYCAAFDRPHLSDDTVLYAAVDVLIDHVDAFLPNPLLAEDGTFRSFQTSSPASANPPPSPASGSDMSAGAAYMIYSGDRMQLKLSPSLAYRPWQFSGPNIGKDDVSAGHFVDTDVPWELFQYRAQVLLYSQVFTVHESYGGEGKFIVHPFDTILQAAFRPMDRSSLSNRNRSMTSWEPQFFVQIDTPVMSVDVSNSLMSAGGLLRSYGLTLLSTLMTDPSWSKNKDRRFGNVVVEAIKDPRRASEQFLSPKHSRILSHGAQTLLSSSPSNPSYLSSNQLPPSDPSANETSSTGPGDKLEHLAAKVPLFLALVHVGTMSALPITIRNIQLVVAHTDKRHLPQLAVKQLVQIEGLHREPVPHVLQTVFSPDIPLHNQPHFYFAHIRAVDRILEKVARFAAEIDQHEMLSSLYRSSVASLSARYVHHFSLEKPARWEGDIAYYEFRGVGSGKWCTGRLLLQDEAMFVLPPKSDDRAYPKSASLPSLSATANSVTAVSDASRVVPRFAIVLRADSAIEYYRDRRMLRESYGVPDGLSCAILRSGDVSLLIGSLNKPLVLECIQRTLEVIEERRKAVVAPLPLTMEHEQLQGLLDAIHQARIHMSSVRSQAHTRADVLPADRYIRRIIRGPSSDSNRSEARSLRKDSFPLLDHGAEENFTDASREDLVAMLADRDAEIDSLRKRILELEKGSGGPS